MNLPLEMIIRLWVREIKEKGNFGFTTKVIFGASNVQRAPKQEFSTVLHTKPKYHISVYYILC